LIELNVQCGMFFTAVQRRKSMAIPTFYPLTPTVAMGTAIYKA